MATNPNMVAIQTVTVPSGGAASIDFTNIPQTYTDLVVKISARNTDIFANIRWTINGTTTGYSERMLYNSNGTPGSTTASGSPYFQFLYQTTSSLTANTFNNAEIYIPNYTGSNNKSISVDNTQENNGTTISQSLTAALWSNTSAINALSFGTSGGNFAEHSSATLYGVTSAGYGAYATGGIISEDNDYWYHTFTASGTFTPTQNLSCDLIMIGGGGSGNVGKSGTFYGGGGGAGQVLNYTSQSLTASSNYTVTIGGGGSPISGTTLNVNGNAGTATQFTGLTSANGGGGGLYSTGFGGTSGNGFAGGSPSGALCGGGGGSGGAGGNAPGSNGAGTGGDGGPGTTSYGTWLPVQGLGELISGSYYIGGGGAGSYPNGQGGYGGGGGDGAFNFDAVIMAGKINTGSGGCGGNYSTIASGAGGSGVVIVRYAK